MLFGARHGLLILKLERLVVVDGGTRVVGDLLAEADVDEPSGFLVVLNLPLVAILVEATQVHKH